MSLATLQALLTSWPLAFLVGLVVGLALASKYRIVKAPENEGQHDHEHHDRHTEG
jgi:hypothetical protein